MRPSKLLLAAPALCFSLAGCGRVHEQAASSPRDAEPTPAATAELPGVALACGCSLPAVGHCSEWAEIDGEQVELVLPATSNLGPMPFCGRTGLRAELEGELVEGKFVVTNFHYVP